MDWTRKRKLMLLWSLLTAGLIALFWTIWYLCAGSVPAVSSIKMTPEWTLALPFAISRWWDILLGPICSIIAILLLTSEKIRNNEDVAVGLAFGLAFGLAVGLAVGLGVGLVVGLAVLLKYLFSRKFWSAIGRWLAAK